MTAGDDTCQVTSASTQVGLVDGLGQSGASGSAGDILKLDAGAGTSFSFDLSKIGTEFTNFETIQIEGTSAKTLTVSGTNSASAVWVNHGFVRGNANFVGNFTSDGGTLAPGVLAGNVGTMTITGGYAGGANRGTLQMDVNLAVAPNPGVTSDFIHVTGVASGGSFIDVIPSNVTAGIATTGHGIQLMQVDGPGSSAGFGLAHQITSGAYQYIPVWVPDYSGTLDGLFLQSVLREEFYASDALLAGGQAMVRACFRSDQRIPDAPRARDNARVWGGVESASFNTDTDVGVKMEDQMYCGNGGIDFGIGDGIRFGAVGGFGNSTIDVTTPGSGIVNLEGTSAAIEALLAIGTPQYFFNVTAGYATTDWTYTGNALASADATQSGMIASAQAGATINVTPFRFKFIGAVNYDKTSCGNDCLLSGMTEDSGIVEAKGTLRIEAMTHQINPYIAVSFSDDLSGGNAVSFGGESLNLDAGHSLLSLNGGFNAPVDDGLLIYGDFSIIDGMGNSTSGYSVAGGFKAYW